MEISQLVEEAGKLQEANELGTGDPPLRIPPSRFTRQHAFKAFWAWVWFSLASILFFLSFFNAFWPWA